MGETRTAVLRGIDDAGISAEVPTASLRWKNGVLQQQIKTIRFAHGQRCSEVNEWRDVPTLSEDSTNG